MLSRAYRARCIWSAEVRPATSPNSRSPRTRATSPTQKSLDCLKRGPRDDESDESVSPRARELYCTEEWVRGLPPAKYPGGDLCIYDDEQRCRFVIIRKLTLSGGVGRKCVVTYATDRYDPDDREDKEAKEEDVLEA